MPLPRRLFDMNVSPDCERVMREAYHFLSKNRELAYSREEIQEEMARLPAVKGMEDDVPLALNALASLAAIRTRRISETSYYAFGREFDTGTWVSMRHLDA